MSSVISNSSVFKSSRLTALFLLFELYHVIENKIKTEEKNIPENEKTSHELKQILEDLLKHDSSQTNQLKFRSESPKVIKFVKFYLEFNHICERFHRVSLSKEKHLVPKLMTEFEAIKDKINPEDFKKFLEDLEIDLVFTAHPTEIFERKILKKYIQLHKNLKKLLVTQNFNSESNLTKERQSILLSLWLSPDYGTQRPTPKDEAKLGQLIYQYSLWDGLTQFKKRFYSNLKKYNLPLDSHINFIKFSSWMGSDKDGNPNITADVTESVVKSFAKKSLNLYYRELKRLKEDLCFEINLDGTVYPIEKSVDSILKKIGSIIKNNYDFNQIKNAETEILTELKLIYKRLVSFNAKFLADRRLRSLVDRLESFGLLGMRWDLRQESAYHDQAIDDLFKNALTKKFSLMSESDRIAWISNDLSEKLIQPYFKNEFPINTKDFNLTSESVDFINTLKLMKKFDHKTFPNYVISMTRSASDLLLVKKFFDLLNINSNVVPLFETLEDLKNSPGIMTEYLNSKNIKQTEIPIMLGYSDSAKTGSRIGSVWNLYLAQKNLAEICNQKGFKVQFFHGRGGSIGRGGGPVQHAVASCPPESIKNGFRMTVQGEVIFDRFGFSPIAVQTMMTYAMSIINYNFSIRKKQSEIKTYETVFASLSEVSKNKYRELLNKESFLDYFEKVTPVSHIGDLNIGSRPSKRQGSKKSYRAIPWIFGWTQNRCLLPSWYGAGTALESAFNQYGQDQLKELYEKFFLFRSTMDLIYMTYLKVNMEVFQNYDKTLWRGYDFYSDINAEFVKLKKYLLLIVDPQKINHVNLEDKLYGRLEVLEHLNNLQINLLDKNLKTPDDFTESDKYKLLLTIQSLASGMGNTG